MNVLKRIKRVFFESLLKVFAITAVSFGVFLYLFANYKTFIFVFNLFSNSIYGALSSIFVIFTINVFVVELYDEFRKTRRYDE